MQARHGNNPIPLPAITDDPRWIGRFSREVRKSIAALRDRRIIVNQQAKRSGDVTHPWKASVSGEDEVTVAAGFMFGVVSKRTTGGADDSAWDFVWVPTKYDGSTITEITETCYIYAKMALYDGFSGFGTDIILHWTQKTSEMDEAESRVFQPYGTITVYDSTNDPASEGISGGEEWIVPIAKVKVEDNVLTIEEQYLTHNPTQQLGFFTLQATIPP